MHVCRVGEVKIKIKIIIQYIYIYIIIIINHFFKRIKMIIIIKNKKDKIKNNHNK